MSNPCKLPGNYFGLYKNNHSIIFLGEMQIKFYYKIISTIFIFEKKKFQIMCHMIGLHHY